MNNEKDYFDIAVGNLKAAQAIMSCADGDEAQFTRAAYYVQQSLELALKYILFENGIDTIKMKTHNLPKLADIAKANKIELFLPEYIQERLYIYTDWESKTRYIAGFFVEQHQIERSIEEVYKYLEKLPQLLK